MQEPTLADAVRDLLAAIAAALDVPLADQADDNLTAYALLRRRADEARIIAASVVPGVDARYIAGAAVQLRDWIAESPVTYRTWQNRTVQAADEEPEADTSDACGKCKQPFDPADTRFDGHARHRDTAWCRSCVDNCGDGGTEHVCVICDPARYGGERA
jgi:hypothetical protein